MKLSEIRTVVSTQDITLSEAVEAINTRQQQLSHQPITHRQLANMCDTYQEHWGLFKFDEPVKRLAPTTFKPDSIDALYQQRLAAFLEDYGVADKVKKFNVDLPWIRSTAGPVNPIEFLLDQIERGLVSIRVYKVKVDMKQTLRQFIKTQKMTMKEWSDKVKVDVKRVRRLIDSKLNVLPESIKVAI